METPVNPVRFSPVAGAIEEVEIAEQVCRVELDGISAPVATWIISTGLV